MASSSVRKASDGDGSHANMAISLSASPRKVLFAGFKTIAPILTQVVDLRSNEGSSACANRRQRCLRRGDEDGAAAAAGRRA
eukprot:2645502-Pleurochrysis_carterae.AAC.1